MHTSSYIIPIPRCLIYIYSGGCGTVHGSGSHVITTAAGGEVGLVKAVVIGGTGTIGRHLVGFLLKHKDRVEKVTVLGRRKVEVC